MFVRTSPTRPKRSDAFSNFHSSGSGATVIFAGVPPEKTIQLRPCIRRRVPSNLIRWSGLRVGPEPHLPPWVAWGRRIFKGSRNLHELNYRPELPTSLGKRCFGATRRAGRYPEPQIPRAPASQWASVRQTAPASSPASWPIRHPETLKENRAAPPRNPGRRVAGRPSFPAPAIRHRNPVIAGR